MKKYVFLQENFYKRMKIEKFFRLTFFSLLPLFFFACGAPTVTTGPFNIINETNENLCVYVTVNDRNFTVDVGTESTAVIDVYYNKPSVQIVKSAYDTGNVSNKYVVVNEGFNFKIKNGYSKVFTMKKITTEKNFSTDTNIKYYLVEKNNKISEWSGDYKRIEITDSLSFSCYTSNPEFSVVCEKSGVQVEHGIRIEIKDGEIIFY